MERCAENPERDEDGRSLAERSFRTSRTESESTGQSSVESALVHFTLGRLT